MRLSSASAPAKPNRWIRNSVCCWRWPGETLEHAGIAPGSLAGGRTAVIVGISNSDYIRLAQDEVADVGPYVATGNALSVAANRISYALDLRGPSWAVDTACSSSLVAVHQACRALQRGESDAALAGGST